jgi:hypothetical protein
LIEYVAEQYRRCRPWILKAIQHGGVTEQEILDGLTTFHMQLWEGKHCVVITQDEVETGALFITVISGDAHAMTEFRESLEPQIIEWARTLGKTKLYGTGRRGWVRHAHRFGWTATPYQHGAIVERII